MMREGLAVCFESAALSGADAAVAAPRAAVWMNFRREWLSMGFILGRSSPAIRAIKIVRCHFSGSVNLGKQYHLKALPHDDKLCTIYD
jgi:hypothetical protein